jgi:hypothetical protein
MPQLFASERERTRRPLISLRCTKSSRIGTSMTQCQSCRGVFHALLANFLVTPPEFATWRRTRLDSEYDQAYGSTRSCKNSLRSKGSAASRNDSCDRSQETRARFRGCDRRTFREEGLCRSANPIEVAPSRNQQQLPSRLPPLEIPMRLLHLG